MEINSQLTDKKELIIKKKYFDQTTEIKEESIDTANYSIGNNMFKLEKQTNLTDPYNLEIQTVNPNNEKNKEIKKRNNQVFKEQTSSRGKLNLSSIHSLNHNSSTTSNKIKKRSISESNSFDKRIMNKILLHKTNYNLIKKDKTNDFSILLNKSNRSFSVNNPVSISMKVKKKEKESDKNFVMRYSYRKQNIESLDNFLNDNEDKSNEVSNQIDEDSFYDPLEEEILKFKCLTTRNSLKKNDNSQFFKKVYISRKLEKRLNELMGSFDKEFEFKILNELLKSKNTKEKLAEINVEDKLKLYKHLFSKGMNLDNFESMLGASSLNEKLKQYFIKIPRASYNHTSVGFVKSIALNTLNGPYQSKNEDRICIIMDVEKPKNYSKTWPKISFFGVYDGHNGSEVSSFLKENLHKYIFNQEMFPEYPYIAINKAFEDIQKVITDKLSNLVLSTSQSKKTTINASDSKNKSVFSPSMNLDKNSNSIEKSNKKLCDSNEKDKNIKTLNISISQTSNKKSFLNTTNSPRKTKSAQINSCGSTALILLVIDNIAYIANCGNSRAILSTNYLANMYDLSIDHNINNKFEMNRVFKHGGKLNKEIKLQSVEDIIRITPGDLISTRSIGDVSVKNKVPGMIISQPDIVSFYLSHKDDFIFIGTDGVFNTLDSKEINLVAIASTIQKYDELIAINFFDSQEFKKQNEEDSKVIKEVDEEESRIQENSSILNKIKPSLITKHLNLPANSKYNIIFTGLTSENKKKEEQEKIVLRKHSKLLSELDKTDDKFVNENLTTDSKYVLSNVKIDNKKNLTKNLFNSKKATSSKIYEKYKLVKKDDVDNKKDISQKELNYLYKIYETELLNGFLKTSLLLGSTNNVSGILVCFENMRNIFFDKIKDHYENAFNSTSKNEYILKLKSQNIQSFIPTSRVIFNKGGSI